MTQVLIVENERLTANAMTQVLTDAGYHISCVCSTGIDAVNAVKEYIPDVILMDIELDGPIDGISTAKIIKRNYSTPIVYITQHNDQDIFLNAKETFPSNYLTKPYNEQELLRAIELSLNSEKQTNITHTDSIYSKVEDGVFIYTHETEYRKLRYEDILYIQAKGAYTHIYYRTPKDNIKQYYTISLSSNHVADKLNYRKLLRVHRSVIVNIDKIDKIKGAEIYIDEFSVVISKEYRDDILNNTFTRIKKRRT